MKELVEDDLLLRDFIARIIEPGMEQSEIDDARNRGCVVTIKGTGQRWRFDKDNCFEVYRVFFCDVIEDPCTEEDMEEIST